MSIAIFLSIALSLQCVCFPAETESVDAQLFPRPDVCAACAYRPLLPFGCNFGFSLSESEGVIICVFTEQKDHRARQRGVVASAGEAYGIVSLDQTPTPQFPDSKLT